MSCGRLFLGILALLAATSAAALEYRAVEAPAAVLYDTPSAKGKKLYILRRFTPLEVVVKLDGWVKVRDAEGTLGWVEIAGLTEKRQLAVIAAKAEVRREASETSPVLFAAAKWVALEFVEAGPAGWAKVRYRDGATGYVKAAQVWGL